MNSTFYVFEVQHCKVTDEFNILNLSNLRFKNTLLRLRNLVAYSFLSSYSNLRFLNQSDMINPEMMLSFFPIFWEHLN